MYLRISGRSVRFELRTNPDISRTGPVYGNSCVRVKPPLAGGERDGSKSCGVLKAEGSCVRRGRCPLCDGLLSHHGFLYELEGLILKSSAFR